MIASEVMSQENIRKLGLDIRPATRDDAAQIASLHLRAADHQVRSFLPELGLRFLVRYYDILISEPGSIVLCAFQGNHHLAGFVSGTLRAEDHFAILRSNKVRFLMSLGIAVCLRPHVLMGAWKRSRALSSQGRRNSFVVNSGCRIEYWAWDPTEQVQKGSVMLLKTYLALMRDSGVPSVRLEIDAHDRRTKMIHLMLGAKEVDQFTTPDGNDRLILEYNFQNLPSADNQASSL